MTATAHSVRVYLVLDPVQDWEESTTILGVYGSLEAAKMATPRHRLRRYEDGGVYEHRSSRVTWIELWIGDEVRGRWEYNPDTKAWSTTVGHEVPARSSAPADEARGGDREVVGGPLAEERGPCGRKAVRRASPAGARAHIGRHPPPSPR